MINYKALRPGNWIYPTGRSQYRVVTGLLLGMMEKNEDLCKEFEGIELTGELLERIGFKDVSPDKNGMGFRLRFDSVRELAWYKYEPILRYQTQGSGFTTPLPHITTLDGLQNFYFFLTGSELPLPESALIIPQTLEK